MFTLKITRYKKSYDFKENPKLKDGFENNWKNNSLDDFVLLKRGTPIFLCKAQTVANYCFGSQGTGDTVSYGDTVAQGTFVIKCFVPPRLFHGQIHAITKTRDVDGQWINHEAMQTTANGYQTGRWLIHDKFSHRTGRDTNYAWSAGCFILSSADLSRFNKTLRVQGICSGDEIVGYVEEVAR